MNVKEFIKTLLWGADMDSEILIKVNEGTDFNFIRFDREDCGPVYDTNGDVIFLIDVRLNKENTMNDNCVKENTMNDDCVQFGFTDEEMIEPKTIGCNLQMNNGH